MTQSSGRRQLFQLAKKFKECESVLEGAPRLSTDPATAEEMDIPLMRREVSRLTGYLLGLPDADSVSFEEGVQIVSDNYNEQPFWRDILCDWFEFTLTEEREHLQQEGKNLRDQMTLAVNMLNYRQTVIETASEKIDAVLKEKGFPIDGKKLLLNYWKMYQKDPDKADAVLLENPAFFSPIITEDTSEKRTLSPEQATDANKKIAAFFKKNDPFKL